MKLLSLRLKNYRNLTEQVLIPDEKVNIIYGDNAQGKTNLIEAIYLLTGQKSFRGAKENDLLQFGSEFAEIKASFFSQGREQEIRLTLDKSKAKDIYINEIKSTPAELTGVFNSVIFSPTELSLIKDGPSERRSFMDSAISKIMPRYSSVLQKYNKILYQRNTLLSELKYNKYADRDLLLATLDAWEQSMVRPTYTLINARVRYIDRIAPHIKEIYKQISKDREKIEIEYLPSIKNLPEDMERDTSEKIILENIRESRHEDIKNGYTIFGPHRDDFSVSLDGISARSFGSQGQQRSCALALKIAECKVIEEVTGEKPILLLDDVFSELDKTRKNFFLKSFLDTQIFITSCDRTGIHGIKCGQSYRMVDGIIYANHRD